MRFLYPICPSLSSESVSISEKARKEYRKKKTISYPTPYQNRKANKTKSVYLLHLPWRLNLETKPKSSLFSSHFGKPKHPNLFLSSSHLGKPKNHNIFLSLQNLSALFYSDSENPKSPNLLLSFGKMKFQCWQRLLPHPLKTQNLR